MAQAPDGSRLSAGVMAASLSRRWLLIGGEEDEGGVRLHVTVTDEKDPLKVALWVVDMPLRIVGNKLVTGPATSAPEES